MSNVTCPRCQNVFSAVPEKKSRPLSAYNNFFTEKMQDPAIRALPHKDRMQRIGQMWQESKASAAAATQTGTKSETAAAPTKSEIAGTVAYATAATVAKLEAIQKAREIAKQ